MTRASLDPPAVGASADIDGMDAIPDPAARVVGRTPPPAIVPAEPSPTRADRARRSRVITAGAAGWIAALLALTGARPDLASPLVIAPLAAWTLACVIGLRLVLRPRDRGLPPGVRVVEHALWIVPALYVISAIAMSAANGDPPFAWSSVGACLTLTGVMSLGPLAAAALLLRGSFLSASTRRGAAVGALAGLTGSIGIHLHCPDASLGHLLAAHGPSIALGAILGAVLGRMRGRA